MVVVNEIAKSGSVLGERQLPLVAPLGLVLLDAVAISGRPLIMLDECVHNGS